MFDFEPIFRAFIDPIEAHFVILRRSGLRIELLSRPARCERRT